nr:Crp-like helix-turn-helix domain protein [uncultured bacterium]
MVKEHAVKDFLDGVSAGKSEAQYPSGTTIFAQDDGCHSIFYLKAGSIKLAVVSQRGKEAVIGLLRAGEFFGEGCLTGNNLRMASAVTMAHCTIVKIEKEAMKRALHTRPEFAEKFTAYLLAKNARTEADLVDLLFNSSEKRLARVLLLLANFGKDGDLQPVLTRISQETLAEMIGTTRSRVSSFMNKFRRLGYIDYNGHLTIHSSLLNVVLHDNPALKDRLD